MPFDGVMKRRRRTRTEIDIEILRNARAGIRKAWCQGTMVRGQKHCAFGWLAEASGIREALKLDDLVTRTLIPVMPARFADEPAASQLMNLNDHPKTTQQDMVNLFGLAIKRLEAEWSLA